MSTRSIALTLFAFCAIATAPATPYWIAWEGDDWPENQGWTRSYGTFNDPGGGQAVRTLSGGYLTIDGMQGTGVYDDYLMDLPGAFDPDSGEVFVAQWRMRVDAVTPSPYHWDPSVGLLTEGYRFTLFAYGYDRIWELAENVVISVEPRVFHSYEYRSTDMLTYQFYVDGTLALGGTTAPGIFGPRFAWGDGFSPSESVATWDYVRFGVVPEPANSLCAVSLSAFAVSRRNRV